MMSVCVPTLFLPLIWMLHAQSPLRCEHEVMADDGMRKFIARMTNTKRE